MKLYHQKMAALLAALMLGCVSCFAKQVGVKTNLLYDATASPSIGGEIRVAPRWSVEVSGSLNGWDMSGGKKWRHWEVQPEVRYWLCEALHGHFFGAHLLGGQYNVGHLGWNNKILGIDFKSLHDNRYQGWAVGGGFNYGYSWLLGRHWNLEAEIGVGYLYTRYDTYRCAGCGKKIDAGRHKNYFGPTEAAINIVYIF